MKDAWNPKPTYRYTVLYHSVKCSAHLSVQFAVLFPWSVSFPLFETLYTSTQLSVILFMKHLGVLHLLFFLFFFFHNFFPTHSVQLTSAADHLLDQVRGPSLASGWRPCIICNVIGLMGEEQESHHLSGLQVA